MRRWRWGKPAPETAGLREDLDRMRAQLDALLAICRDAGVSVTSAAGDAVDGVPAHLIAASRTRRPGGEPVMLTSPDGRQVIAVVTPDGDPRSWWAEIRTVLS